MTSNSRTLRVALALAAAGSGLFWGGPSTMNAPGSFVSQASAVIGRPATPMSYAGVARRTTRRSVAYGAAAGAAAAGAYTYAYPGPACRQVVNSYGQIVYRCP
jgi:hypothetical protein